jgi:exodeoxyribonuclease VII large subunit
LSAPEGAAIRDIISVAGRRDPGVELHLYPTIVQGMAAVKSITANLDLVQKVGNYDVVLLARGGGSLEDLQAFNNEDVARAVANCSLPTVSAVGHEVDFSITDFVADLRAATPSVAAELLIPDKLELSQKLAGMQNFLHSGLNRLLSEQYQELDYHGERLAELMRRILDKYGEKTAALLDRLNDLNPLQVLERGFALTEKDGRPVALKGLQNDDIISIRFKDGKVKARVIL